MTFNCVNAKIESGFTQVYCANTNVSCYAEDVAQIQKRNKELNTNIKWQNF